MKFEDNTGNDIDLNKFDLLIKFINNIFDAKKSTDKALIKRTKMKLLINLYKIG